MRKIPMWQDGLQVFMNGLGEDLTWEKFYNYCFRKKINKSQLKKLPAVYLEWVLELKSIEDYKHFDKRQKILPEHEKIARKYDGKVLDESMVELADKYLEKQKPVLPAIVSEEAQTKKKPGRPKGSLDTKKRPNRKKESK